MQPLPILHTTPCRMPFQILRQPLNRRHLRGLPMAALTLTAFADSDPERSVGFEWYDQHLDTGWRALSRWPAPEITVSVMSQPEADSIVNNAGATIPFRDSTDTRVIADYFAGTGNFIDNVDYPDDFPVFQNRPASADSDNVLTGTVCKYLYDDYLIRYSVPPI